MTVEKVERAPGAPHQRAESIWNNPRYRAFFYQAVVVAAVVALVWWLTANVMRNIAMVGRGVGFDFLDRVAGFAISFSLIAVDRSSTYLEIYFAGILNTLLVAVIGIVLATIVGLVVGIARLSPNWLIRKTAMVYVEIVRNVPLLLQLFFWYFAVLQAMPSVRDSIYLPLGLVLNLRGLYLPQPIPDDRFWIVAVAFAIGIVGFLAYRSYARRLLEATGKRLPVVLPGLALLVAAVAIAWLLSGTQMAFSFPELQGFNFAGGFSLPPELTALLAGLVIYTSAFIAETVRAGIISVSHGQTEAAAALGLGEGDRLRLVILPQALRVIIPPLTSQYLNLTKNSSLGAAIGFPELVSVFPGTTLNQTGRAIEVIALTMLVYLTFSLITSMFMNWYNARVRLVER
ncbi:MAG TPA: ABC transporter permease subunit [Devosiaceae bacterium]|jgi:general L-amino acid transport system permease protein|nr:ABC transporter permease subunit [Devosiaceae bacterium]